MFPLKCLKLTSIKCRLFWGRRLWLCGCLLRFWRRIPYGLSGGGIATTEVPSQDKGSESNEDPCNTSAQPFAKTLRLFIFSFLGCHSWTPFMVGIFTFETSITIPSPKSSCLDELIVPICTSISENTLLKFVRTASKDSEASISFKRS